MPHFLWKLWNMKNVQESLENKKNRDIFFLYQVPLQPSRRLYTLSKKISTQKNNFPSALAHQSMDSRSKASVHRKKNIRPRYHRETATQAHIYRQQRQVLKRADRERDVKFSTFLLSPIGWTIWHVGVRVAQRNSAHSISSTSIFFF